MGRFVKGQYMLERKKKIQLALAIAGTVCLVAAFFFVLYNLEHAAPRRPDTQKTSQGASAGMGKAREGAGKKEEEKGRILRMYGQKYAYTDDIHSYLLIGTDDSGNASAQGEEYRGEMADMLMLAIINHTKKSVSILQLNRDTMAEIRLLDTDGTGEATASLQLCTAHWYGGNEEQSCENTVEAVSGLLGGVPVDGYYALGMEAIRVLNHAVGGVTVTVRDDFSSIDPLLKMGEQIRLNDDQACHFVQARYGVGDEENLSRMGRHRQYFSSLFARIREKTDKDAQFPLKLYQELGSHTVTSITPRQLSEEAAKIHGYQDNGIYTIEGTVRLGEKLGDGLAHVEYHLDKESKIRTEMELFGLQEIQDDT